MSKHCVRVQRREQQRRRFRMWAATVGAVVASGTFGRAYATQYVYTPSGTTDQWSAGTNWSTTPVSGVDAQLTFVGDNTSVLADGQASVSNNDIAGNFQLNILDLQGTGPSPVTLGVTTTISGNALEFVANTIPVTPVDPVINLNALGAAGHTYLVNNNVILTNNTTIAGNGTATFTFGGVVSGGGTLTKTGASAVTFTGANTYTGVLNINAGTVRGRAPAALPGRAALGQINVAAGATVGVNVGGVGEWTLSDVDTLLASATFAAGTLPTVNAALDMQVASGNTLTYGSTLSGNVRLSKSGNNSTLVLTGTNTNTGGVSVSGSGSVLSVSLLADGGVASNIGASTSDNTNLAISSGATLQYTGPTVTIDRAIRLGGTVGPGNWNTIEVTNPATTLTLASSSTHFGNSLRKAGPGALTLGGTQINIGGTNTVDGGTLLLQRTGGNVINGAAVINAGATLKLGSTANADQIHFNTDVTLNGGTFDLNGQSIGGSGGEEIGDLIGTSGVITNSAATLGRIVVGGGTAGTTNVFNYTGTIQDGAGPVALRLVHRDDTARIHTLSVGQTHSGGTDLGGSNNTGARIHINHDTAVGTGTVTFGYNNRTARIESTTGPRTFTNNNAQTWANNLFLHGTNAFNLGTGTVTLTGNRTVTVEDVSNTLTVGGTIQNDATLTRELNKEGAGTLVLNGNNTFGGRFEHRAGTVVIGHGNALGALRYNFGNNSAPVTLRSSVAGLNLSTPVQINGTLANPSIVGGANDVTFTGSVSGGQAHAYLQVDNGATTISGPVYISNSLTNGRTLHVSGGGAAVIGGTVSDANGAGLAGSLEYNGTGTLTLTGANTYTGTTTVGSGTVVLENSLTTSSAVTIGAAGTLRIGANGNRLLATKSITVSDGGLLAMNDNDFIVDYDVAGPSPELELRDKVKSIYLGGTTGISYAPGAGDVAIAVAERTEWGFSEFNGVALDTTAVVGKYTYFGDANLDGKVTSDDYVAVDVGLGTGDSWVQGDFNFSGTVTSDDYVAIDVNLGKGSPTPLAFAELKAEMIALHTAMFGDEYVQKLAQVEAQGFAALVPEPGAMGLVGVAATALLVRRTRRRQ